MKRLQDKLGSFGRQLYSMRYFLVVTVLGMLIFGVYPEEAAITQNGEPARYEYAGTAEAPILVQKVWQEESLSYFDRWDGDWGCTIPTLEQGFWHGSQEAANRMHNLNRWYMVHSSCMLCFGGLALVYGIWRYIGILRYGDFLMGMPLSRKEIYRSVFLKAYAFWGVGALFITLISFGMAPGIGLWNLLVSAAGWFALYSVAYSLVLLALSFHRIAGPVLLVLIPWLITCGMVSRNDTYSRYANFADRWFMAVTGFTKGRISDAVYNGIYFLTAFPEQALLEIEAMDRHTVFMEGWGVKEYVLCFGAGMAVCVMVSGLLWCFGNRYFARYRQEDKGITVPPVKSYMAALLVAVLAIHGTMNNQWQRYCIMMEEHMNTSQELSESRAVDCWQNPRISETGSGEYAPAGLYARRLQVATGIIRGNIIPSAYLGCSKQGLFDTFYLVFSQGSSDFGYFNLSFIGEEYEQAFTKYTYSRSGVKQFPHNVGIRWSNYVFTDGPHLEGAAGEVLLVGVISFAVTMAGLKLLKRLLDEHG